jgi:hypothetical protein
MARNPSNVEISSACDTLRAAGWVMEAPASRSLALLTIGELRIVLRVGLKKARRVAVSLPGTVYLPGGDIRVRVKDVATYLDAHPYRLACSETEPQMRGQK